MGTRASIAVLVCWLMLSGCASTPDSSSATIDSTPISLDEAKRLISAGEVKEIFQPHHGCVLLTLQDGRHLTFDQPYLDWILEFVHDNGLEGKVGGISIE